jgi:hypothetical protein
MNRRGDHRGNLFLVSAVKSDTARAVYLWHTLRAPMRLGHDVWLWGPVCCRVESYCVA